MNKPLSIQIFVVLLSLSFVTNSAALPCHEVVGYYAGWKWYKRNKLVNPETIDYSKYTIINYAFFKPLEDGTVIEGDAWADKNILLGVESKKAGSALNEIKSSLVYQAHLNDVKVIASVGGWTYSSVFPQIAADPAKRKQFAVSCIQLLKKYNLDGIDIDWEYPGHKAHNGTLDDKQNFTLLLRILKVYLDEYSVAINRKMYLTAAFGPAPNHMEQIEWDQVVPLLDIVNLMSYNYYGAWDP
ncbi:MAG: hypothetical protein IPP71_21735 [Bacteroidetes bacterium]|nr:hypothetical protein [Bacteroidota bacterium]